MRHIDDLLRTHAAAALSVPARPIPWAIIEPQLAASYDIGPRSPITIFWGRTEIPQFYRSSNWPLEIDPHRFAPQVKVGDEWKRSRRSARAQNSSDQDAENSAGPVGGGSAFSDLERTALLDSLTPIRSDNVEAAGKTWRMNAYVFDNEALVLGRYLDPVLAELSPLRNWFLAACPLSFLLVFGLLSLGKPEPRSAPVEKSKPVKPIKPVETSGELPDLLKTMTADTLTRRVNEAKCPPEHLCIAREFNNMLDRLELSFEDTRRFSGLAAHELKTPIAILQGKIDIAIHEQLPGSSWQQFLATLLDDVARLKAVTEKLLLLSRADAGRLELNISDVDLTELIRQHIEDTEMLAPELKVKATLPEQQIVQGDKTLLNLLLQNLFSNAIKYNTGGERGFIKVDLQEIEHGIRLAVSNSARPIPPELHQRIFSRFGRGIIAAKDAVDGAGLGLSLAYEIARVHGGRIKLKESTPAQTTFVLKLRKVALPPPNISTNWRMLKRVEPLSAKV